MVLDERYAVARWVLLRRSEAYAVVVAVVSRFYKNKSFHTFYSTPASRFILIEIFKWK